jgi:PPOX class probable F420-dependent enzyme
MKLTKEEAWAVLADAHTGILTTMKANGTPISLPMWFVAIDERVYVVTPETTKKVARLRRNPRVSFLVESGERWAELVAVHLTGRARVVEDPHLRAGVRAAMDHKYSGFRTEPSPADAARLADINMAVIEITPDDRILTWDNNRLNQ